MLYGVLPRPDARLLPQVLSPHPGLRAPVPCSVFPTSFFSFQLPASDPVFRAVRSGPRIPPCVGFALRPTHPGSHSGPVFRAARSGLALRSRVPGGVPRSRAPTQTCPHILPRALGGGFEGRILEGGFRVPGSSSGPRVLALCSGPHNPVLAPRLLAFRPASASHFDPRTPARTPVLHSGPVFREGRLLRFEPALRSSRTDPRTPPSHPASHPTSRFGPRTPARTPVPCSGRCAPVSRTGPVFRAAYPGPVLRPRPAPHILPHALGGGFWRRLLPPGPLPHFVPRSRPRAPASRSGPVFRAAYPGPVLRPRPAPHILPHALGGGFWRRLLPPGPLPHFVPRSRPRAPAPAFPPRISGGGFEGGFSGNILERRIPGGCFEGGGLRSGSCVRPRRCVSELRILANRQNKVYL